MTRHEPNPDRRAATPATGQAARVVAAGEVEIIDIAPAAPGLGEVRLRIEGCGVCASNLEPWAGPDWMEFPTEPGGLGHEAWGRVEALGEGVTGFTTGQRVAWLGSHGFATHEVVAADGLVPLPPALDDVPFPLEPLGCAMNIFRRSAVRPGDHVAIIGIGFLGAVLTRLCADAGAKVVAITRRQSQLALARQLGAVRTIAMEDHYAIIDEVREATGGRMCDVVIEAVGKQWPLDLAGELVAESGRLVIAGYHQDGPRQVNMQNWNWRGIDIVNAHERREDVNLAAMRDAVTAVATGRIDIGPLLTHSYPLAELASALNVTRDRPEGFVKAYVTC
jgi:NADPH:quinone reductase